MSPTVLDTTSVHKRSLVRPHRAYGPVEMQKIDDCSSCLSGARMEDVNLGLYWGKEML